MANAETGAGHLRQGQSTHWHVQDPGLGVGQVGKLGRLSWWAAVSTNEHETWDCGGQVLVQVGTQHPSVSQHLDRGWGQARLG